MNNVSCTEMKESGDEEMATEGGKIKNFPGRNFLQQQNFQAKSAYISFATFNDNCASTSFLLSGRVFRWPGKLPDSLKSFQIAWKVSRWPGSFDYAWKVCK